MIRRTPLALALVALAAVPACDASGGDGSPTTDAYAWDLPEGFPTPRVPDDNPMNDAKVELGRRLFYDTRLSGNETESCATCHQQARAFTEDQSVSVGSTGESHFRNAMSLTNVGYNATQTWSNPILAHLEDQALIPMFGETPVELGLAGMEDELVARVGAVPVYQELFPEAFPDTDGAVTLDRITKAIAAFERTLISGNSKYDRFWYGRDPDALNESERRGLELFLGERLECFHCHGGFNFQDSSVHAGSTFDETSFHNNGLYNLDGAGAYPASDRGVYDISHDPADMGRFKAPTLRNIALTAPYMHDGSIATLEDVIAHYERGGRLIEDGPDAGDGAESPLKSVFVRGFVLTEQERADLLAFLHALTDESFTTDPRFSDPWVE
ncbi:MAG: di-heme enzyme [Myxococcales bacterium]|nr:di-heme enzyme [Myxococcales bacterium]MCB9731763.1 di-heme enzyme [Deltaproteobacteria bacterium]